MLKFWHPVLESRDLPGAGVVGVKVAGQSLAIFRTAAGRLGAVEDKCVHRRMKLSVGKVRQERLVCAYHGWTFDRDGQGESPSSPKMHACLPSYECAEAYGTIWVRSRASAQELPKLGLDGWDFVGPVVHRVAVPLQLIVDNLSELEHTVTTHAEFGFDPARASEAVVEYETTEDAIMARSHGPAKMPPLATRVMVGIRRGDQFHSDYSFHFDPPRSAVTHFWIDPRTGRKRMVRYHVVVYFVPEDENNTRVISLGFLQIRWPLLRRLGKFAGWLVRRKIRATLDEDVFLVENLADKSTGLEGMKLGRFDAILAMTRERLRRIYFEDPPAADRSPGAGRPP